MGKSVYSLVLSDEIIREVDQLAYRNGTNRSNMINQILADHVSVSTPEMRMREIFDRMEKLLLDTDFGHNAFQLQSLPSDTMFSLRSAISYKYNPTVRYNVELYRQNEEDGAFGELRVNLRTQNQNLIQALDGFYSRWQRIEATHFPDVHAASNEGKYARKLKLRFRTEPDDSLSGLTVGEVISNYLNTFDHALKVYFELLAAGVEPTEQLNQIYDNYLTGEVYL